MNTKKRTQKTEVFTPAEQRAARSARIVVSDAEPYGWMAHSESHPEQVYHLFRDPETRRLVCTCADFIFRGDAAQNYECKHISAVLKYIGRRYLELEYDPQKQYRRAA
ncbi:MAG TPA: hypothetical protein VGV59_06805 [Pyrinomonadaceae bacterium]|nr:hypothetical protein [Pyrinomonadaceae bacterium]